MTAVILVQNEDGGIILSLEVQNPLEHDDVQDIQAAVLDALNPGIPDERP